MMVHFTQETQQRWAPPVEAGSEDGTMLWLPGGVFLELRMVSAVRSPAAAYSRCQLQLSIALRFIAQDSSLQGVDNELQGLL